MRRYISPPPLCRLEETNVPDSDRKPIDPPPIVQLKVSPKKDPMQNFLQNPYLIMSCQLIKAEDEKDPQPTTNALLGTIVSSLYSLKDTDNSLGGFFVFGDLSVKCEGQYRLEFTLFELRLVEKECYLLATTRSDTFTVYPQKFFPGMAESTFLTRSFSDQGVRLRLRKDSRSITTRKRNSTVADFARQYSRHDQDPQNHRDHPSRSSSINEVAAPSTPLDRSRGMAPQGGAYFDNSQQLREYAVGPTSNYPTYGGYEDRPSKRQRMTDHSSSQGYDHHDYTAYQAGPRTVPDLPTTSMLPYTTGYAVTSHAAAVGLPMPSPYSHPVMPPRLDTQMPPSAGPSSATSTFSPGTRRSPGQSQNYPYPPQQMYQSPSTTLHYPSQPPPGPQNGLGIGLDLDAVEKHMQHSQNNGTGL